MLRNLRVITLFVAMAVILTGASHAATIISNLNGNDGTGSIGLTNLRNKGMGFTMPAGPDYVLDDVTLRLRLTSTNPNPIVQFWSNSATNLPGSALITLNNPLFGTTGVSNHLFTPPAPFTLQAGTTYWLVVYRGSTGTSFDWVANNPGIAPTGIAVHFGQHFDSDGPPPTGTSTIFNSYAITGHEVAEPTTLILCLFISPSAINMIRQRNRVARVAD